MPTRVEARIGHHVHVPLEERPSRRAMASTCSRETKPAENADAHADEKGTVAVGFDICDILTLESTGLPWSIPCRTCRVQHR